VWGTGGGRRKVCRRRQAPFASQAQMRDSHHHVVRSGVPQTGLCAASAVGSGVTWWGTQGIGTQWESRARTADARNTRIWMCGIESSDANRDTWLLHYSHPIYSSIPRTGYNCPAFTLPARISSLMLRDIHSGDCRVQHLLDLI
jgi:hypothetical protein